MSIVFIKNLIKQVESYIYRNIENLDFSDYEMLSVVLAVLDHVKTEEEEKKWKK